MLLFGRFSKSISFEAPRPLDTAWPAAQVRPMRLPDPSAADPALFDPLGPEFTRNPYPVYARLRAMNAPYYFAPYDIWLFSRFAEIGRAHV